MSVKENVELGNNDGTVSTVFSDGTYNIDQLNNPSQYISLYVPPHKSVRLSTSPVYSYENSIVYAPGTYKNLSLPNIGVGAGQIKSLRVMTVMPWTDFKLACCRGETSDQVDSTSCGQFWKASKTGDCDSIMTTYCKANPWDTDACSCVNSKVAGIAPCIDPNCTNSGAFLTSTQRKILDEGCPDRTICTQNIIVGNDAYANLINLKLTQTCGVNSGTSDTTTTTTTYTSNELNYLYIVLVFICLVIAAIAMYEPSKEGTVKKISLQA